ncbi:MAG: ISNCY family transposase [Patescibacteria group bacterium]|mgnify:CR=1 FL=1
MSTKELDRAAILQRVIDKKLTQKTAAQSLGITERHLRRLATKYRAKGTAGLANQARGKPSNRRLLQDLKDQAIELVRTKYSDFGPTLAAEKLAERDNIRIGTETLRGLMAAAGLWKPKQRKAIHRTRRERRSCYGDMAQFDGCRHDWFEGRLPDGAWATLLASRDDANNMVRAWFLPYEGTRPVMTFWWKYFVAYGKPNSIYLDKHSTYKVNAKNALDDDAMLSQFERAMKQLDVRLIHANSPQAKGRIENLFGTLQDRLVKELRLAEINGIAAANTFLKDIFLPAFNERFCVIPQSKENIHRPLRPSEIQCLPSIFSIQSTRYVNRDFTIRFKNQWLQLSNPQPTLVLPGNQATIEERLDNTIHLKLNGYYLPYATLTAKPALAKTKTFPIALTSSPALTGQTTQAMGIDTEQSQDKKPKKDQATDLGKNQTPQSQAQTQTQTNASVQLQPAQPKSQTQTTIETKIPAKPPKPRADHPWRKPILLPYNITNRPNQKQPSRRQD